MSAKAKDDITVVASLTVTSALGTEQILSFDRAWHRAMELPMPVDISFNGFVRKETP